MQRTIFRTPFLSTLLRGLSLCGLRLWGWKVVGEKPQAPKYILCGAPHTSNWDFPLMLMVMLALRMDVHWMGKNTLFPKPLAGLVRWLGGIPIDRSRSNNTVEQMVVTFGHFDELVVLIPPEGTRSKVQRWKTGFYHIAVGAGVPIQLGFLDAKTKTAGMGPMFYPSGNIEKDLPAIQAYYRDKSGLRANYFHREA